MASRYAAERGSKKCQRSFEGLPTRTEPLVLVARLLPVTCGILAAPFDTVVLPQAIVEGARLEDHVAVTGRAGDDSPEKEQNLYDLSFTTFITCIKEAPRDEARCHTRPCLAVAKHCNPSSTH